MAELRRESPDAHRLNIGGPDTTGPKQATPRALKIMNEITELFAGKNLDGLDVDLESGPVVYRTKRKGTDIELHPYVEHPTAARSLLETLRQVAPDYAAWLEADAHTRGPPPPLSEEGQRVLDRLMEIAG